MLNSRIINKINQEVYTRFPEVDGIQPNIQTQAVQPLTTSDQDLRYLLIFKSQVSVSGSKALHRCVRVVVNEKGKILKITTSR